MGCCNEKLEVAKIEVLLTTDVPPPTARTQPSDEVFCDVSLESPPKYSFTQQSDPEHLDSAIYIDPSKSSDYFISKVTKRMESKDFSSTLDRSSLSLSKDCCSATLPRTPQRHRGKQFSVDAGTLKAKTHMHKASLPEEFAVGRTERSISSISRVESDYSAVTFGEEVAASPPQCIILASQ